MLVDIYMVLHFQTIVFDLKQSKVAPGRKGEEIAVYARILRKSEVCLSIHKSALAVA